MKTTDPVRSVLVRLVALAALAAIGSILLVGDRGSRPAMANTPERRTVPARDDPSPDEEESMAMGRQSFTENCLMCHGEEMTTGQRLTAKQWNTEVEKMIGWGSPVPPEQKAPLIGYLIGRYSDKVPPAPAERMTLEQALASVEPTPSEADLAGGDPTRGAALYTANCATCHGADGRGAELGTNLVQRSVLLRPSEFDEVVRKGRRRMPGFAAALSAAQEADLLAWLRTLRYPPRRP